MSHTGEPFTVTVDGKVVHERVRTKEGAIGLVGPLARQHPGSRVQAFDRYGREVAAASEEVPRAKSSVYN
jgi:hypothetical protein